MYGSGMGISMVSEILTYELGRVGHILWNPRLVLINVCYHKDKNGI